MKCKNRVPVLFCSKVYALFLPLSDSAGTSKHRHLALLILFRKITMNLASLSSISVSQSYLQMNQGMQWQHKSTTVIWFVHSIQKRALTCKKNKSKSLINVYFFLIFKSVSAFSHFLTPLLYKGCYSRMLTDTEVQICSLGNTVLETQADAVLGSFLNRMNYFNLIHEVSILLAFSLRLSLWFICQIITTARITELWRCKTILLILHSSLSNAMCYFSILNLLQKWDIQVLWTKTLDKDWFATPTDEFY